MKMIDLTGEKFGRLTVISRSENQYGRTYWRCKCDCGKTTIVSSNNLKSGAVKSCGCLSSKHGLRHTRLNRIWSGIIQRCYNKNSHAYKYYGERGINVFNAWRNNFKIFYDWAMTNGYADNLTIDRIDVNGNYDPLNCRWVNKKQQANNRSNNISISYNGKTQTIAEWENEFGFKSGVIGKRLRKGMSVEKALKERFYPKPKTRFITYNGETRNIKEWSVILGIKYCTLVSRLTTQKWSIERAFSEGVK
jgi:hypothetical protein